MARAAVAERTGEKRKRHEMKTKNGGERKKREASRYIISKTGTLK